jgi:hypothetical protein
LRDFVGFVPAAGFEVESGLSQSSVHTYRVR